MTSLASIPIVDLSSATSATALLDAARTHGFIYISSSSSPLSPSLIASLFTLSREFFKAPLSTKNICAIRNNAGYSPLQNEALDGTAHGRGDWKETFNLTVPLSSSQALSGALAEDAAKETIRAFERGCHDLCTSILRALAIGLEVENPNWFTERHDLEKGQTGSVLRLLHYPSLASLGKEAAGETDIRAGAHSDYGSITLLFQQRGQPGLEIKTEDGRWVGVEVDPANSVNGKGSQAHGIDEGLPILVNIGDLLSYWTNGLLRSTVHRVIFPEGAIGDRYSVAYFCHPLDDAELVSVPSKIVTRFGEEHGVSDQGRQLTAKDHLMEKLEATYKTK